MSESDTTLQQALGTEPDEALTIRGREIPIRPLTLEQIADILAVVERLQAKGLVEVGLADGTLKTNFSEAALFMRGGQDALDILRTAARLDTAFVKSLDAVEGLRLFKTVYAVNRDFFLRNRAEVLELIAPLVGDLGSLVDAVTVRLAGIIGRLSSPDSSAPDTRPSESAATH
jgi:hypothetical protein